MTTAPTAPRVLSRSDAFAFSFFMLVGVAFAVWASIRGVISIITALPNRDVAVLIPFDATPAAAPIGPGGGEVGIQVESAVVTVPSLPVASLVALVIADVLLIAVIVTVVALLLVLSFGILRGRIFSRRHAALVVAAGTSVLVGVIGVPFFQNMVANGALARISDYGFDRGYTAMIDLPVLFGAAFLAALAGTVFAVGERLQRDTEGLV